METVVVAGGAGFIGSHLCLRLLRDKYKVICVDSFITGDRANIEPFLSNPNFTCIEHDISRKFWAVTPQIEKVNYIFHLASPASPNKKSPRSYINYPIETLLANSAGTHALLDLAKEKGAKFLYASSSEVYGDPTVSPQNEEYFGNVNPNGVRSVYDEGKRFGEAITMAYVRKYGLRACIVRIFNTYGPIMQPDDGRVVSNFITQAIAKKPLTIYGDGNQTRSFCFVDDMIEGLIRAMFTKESDGEAINLGNPDERTVRDLAHLVKKMVGSTSEIVLDDLPQEDPKRRLPDIQKAKRLLNWEPKVPLEQGLEKTIAYFKTV